MYEDTETVKVFCRLKPSLNQNEEPCVFYEMKNGIENLRSVPPAGARRNAKENLHYFSRIFNEKRNQQEIYEEVAYPLLEDLIDGKNGLFFTYGVTGSGKTYTMQGSDSQPGLVPRILKSLFERINLLQRYRVQSDLRNGFKVIMPVDSMCIRALNRNYFSRRSGESTCVSYMNNITDIENDFPVESNCTVFISIVEVYGKRIIDLLKNNSDPAKDITIKEDGKKNKYLHNATEMEVQSAAEAFYLYNKAQKKRKVESTKLNSESSRSHLIFNIRLVKLNNDLSGDYRNKTGDKFSQIIASKNNVLRDGNSPSRCQFDDITSEVGTPICYYRMPQYRTVGGSGTENDQIRISQLSLVDLAGSERNDRSGTNGTRLKEAGDINNSLMVLRRCMELLRDKNRNNANKPDYRSSELTHLFKTALEGGSTIRMIVCVQSCPQEYEETLNVLQFADQSQEITMQVQKTQEPIKLCKPDSIQNLAKDQDTELKLQTIYKRMNEIWDFVERRRMPEIVVTNNVFDDINCIYELLTIDDEMIQLEQQGIDAIVEEELGELRTKLTVERNVNSKSKKQLSEYQIKVLELEAKILDMKEKLSGKDERIRNAEEELRSIKLKLHHEQIQDKENGKVTKVKEIAKKYENNIIASSKKFVCKAGIGAPVQVPSTRRGFHNPNYRKSKSQERWVLHEPKNVIPMGTLNQVKLKTKLTTKNPDIKGLRKSDKYLLQNQSVNKDSELKTAYHKGNIVPTAGGGVAVSLYEVETVTQNSAAKKNKNRRSSSFDEFHSKRLKEEIHDDYDDETY